MLQKLFCSVFFLILIAINCTHAASENKSSALKPINDTIVEFFHNCECGPYYLCNVLNNFLAIGRANLIPKEIKCTDPINICCKHGTDPDEATPTTPTNTTETPPIPSISDTRGNINGSTLNSCGVAKTQVNVRILTPDTASATTIPGEIPWMVEIFQKRNNKDNPYRFKCAGSLIHPKVILTAAHCVVSNKAQQLKLVATGGEIFQNIGVRTEDERNVVEIIKHPEFYSGGLFNDIALLIIEEEYNFTSGFLNSICMPNANQSFSGTGKCLAVGWGENKDLASLPLKKVDVPIVDSETCQNLLRKTYLGPDFNLHLSFTCAGGEEGKDTCKGDGGGPLICLHGYKFVQAGIVSWGVNNECGIANQPGLYTDVGKFKDWIDGELKKNEITLN